MMERHRKIKIKKFNFIFFPFCVKLRSAERKTDKLKNTGLMHIVCSLFSTFKVTTLCYMGVTLFHMKFYIWFHVKFDSLNVGAVLN